MFQNNRMTSLHANRVWIHVWILTTVGTAVSHNCKVVLFNAVVVIFGVNEALLSTLEYRYFVLVWTFGTKTMTIRKNCYWR